MNEMRTPIGGSAAALEAALGMRRVEDDGDWTVLRLDPTPLTYGDEGGQWLHGGALSACIESAAWDAIVRERPGEWVAVDMRVDFLRMASPVPYRVAAVVRRAGRRTAVI